MPREQWDTKAVAEFLKVKPGTVRTYSTATSHARYGFPKPDGYIANAPWWWSTTIKAWAKDRPGRTAPNPPRKALAIPR